jgi:hypothetical protein
MLVPLGYGPRDKFLARAQANEDGQRETAIQLPRMSFQMTGLAYDPTRKQSSILKYSAPGSNISGTRTFQYSPVPYNIGFTLSIMVKNVEDGTFIVEQILPYFTPAWTATLNLNPDLGQKFAVPVTIDDISQEDTYEGSFENRRAIIWTLRFTMQAWFFGPSIQGGKVIQQVDANFRVPPIGMSITDAINLSSDAQVAMSTTPGLSSSNTAVDWYGAVDSVQRPETVPSNTVKSTDPFGFMVDFIRDIDDE